MASADEAFFTSTAFSMLPCVKINGLPIGDGKPGSIFPRLIGASSEEVGVDNRADQGVRRGSGRADLRDQYVPFRQAGCAAMKYDMTSRDRMLAAIRRQPVDHIPLGQLFHSTVLNTPADKQWHDQFERAR